LTEGVLDQVTRPQVVDGQRIAGLRVDDPRVIALMQVLCLMLWLPEGFRNSTLRQTMAQALGVDPEHFSPGQMSYDLRRLSRHGSIERIPKTFSLRQLGGVYEGVFGAVLGPR